MIDIITNKSIIAGRIEEIIQNAKSELVIVSPYVQLDRWPELLQALNYIIKEKTNVKITFIIRQQPEDKPNKALEELKPFADHCTIYLLEDLHSKVFYRDGGKVVLITSMNLYKHSADSNHEIGVYFEDESEKVEKIKTHISVLKSSGEPYFSEAKIIQEEKYIENEKAKGEAFVKEQFTVISIGYKWVKVINTLGYENKCLIKTMPGLKEGSSYEALVKRKWIRSRYGYEVEYIEVKDLQKSTGHCIICNKTIDLNPNAPMCKQDYFKNKKYRGNIYGKVCHNCGKPFKGILDSKPLCNQCNNN